MPNNPGKDPPLFCFGKRFHVSQPNSFVIYSPFLGPLVKLKKMINLVAIMRATRRKFSSGFKAQVAANVPKERESLALLFADKVTKVLDYEKETA
jgi:hypothetical protein